MAQSTANNGNHPSLFKVVGLGSAGVDYLASVSSFPIPDSKMRTDTLEVQGGGNCANALTAVARLGLSASLITKIGDDGLGDGIIRELQAEGVDTSCVLRAEGRPSPFTYIIVDSSGGTRTCIHTPSAPLEPSEMRPELMDAALTGASIVYFDGRLTEAALPLARRARGAGIPVLVEAERLRPNLELLLAEADYVVTSANFPQEFTGESDLGDAILATAQRLPAAKLLITTLGSRGSVLIDRSTAAAALHDGSHGLCLGTHLTAHLQQSRTHNPSPGSSVPDSSEEPCGRSGSSSSSGDNSSSSSSRSEGGSSGSSNSQTPDYITPAGCKIQRGGVYSTDGAVRLRFTSNRDRQVSAKNAAAAAASAARLNADARNAGRYELSASESSSSSSSGVSTVTATVMLAAAACLPKEAVVDTTGAGDAFIGSVVYALATGLGCARMLQLASLVAACKCTRLGARPGLPHRDALPQDLLSEQGHNSAGEGQPSGIQD
ncbi:MAG: hypothetical protein WDW36_005295 [Sanguina aurantia]